MMMMKNKFVWIFPTPTTRHQASDPKHRSDNLVGLYIKSRCKGVDGGGSFIFPAIIFKMAPPTQQIIWRENIVFGGRTSSSTNL